MSQWGFGMAFAWWGFFAWVGRFGVDWRDCFEGGGKFCFGGGMFGWWNVVVVEHNGNGTKNVALAECFGCGMFW